MATEKELDAATAAVRMFTREEGVEAWVSDEKCRQLAERTLAAAEKARGKN